MELLAQAVVDVMGYFLAPFSAILAVSFVVSLFRYK